MCLPWRAVADHLDPWRTAGPLPVDAVLDELVAGLGSAGAAVLAAPPGTGKSTHVPLALAAAPWLGAPTVLVLEPRRLAARAVARRMASLLGEPVGRRVGYRMRGETKVSAATVVEVVTEGVLTRMLHADPALEGAGAVVFDEFHERSLHADLGLALCLDVRGALRPDLRLLVMSATLDSAAVVGLLGAGTAGPIPVVEATGSLHPVEVRWAPPRSDGPGAAGAGWGPGARSAPAVAEVVRRALREVPAGDVLVFLPGAGEIARTAGLLEDLAHGAVVLPLHGRLSALEQDRALAAGAEGGRRKVVLATAIAETSLTIEGVGVVVDAGLSRRARFDPRRGVGGLHTGRVSQAAAEQRRGRAGRLGPGVCYRLWSEAEHGRLAVAEAPEIAAADLAPLALDLARWGDPTGTQLAWLDPPPSAALAAATDLLARLELADGRGRLTAHGRAVADLGLHPRLAHAVVRGAAAGAGGLACDLAALLGERDLGDGRGADLRERLGRVARPGRLRDEAARLRRHSGAGGRPGDSTGDAAGAVLALGWPERVALRRGSTTAGRRDGPVAGRRGSAVARRDRPSGPHGESGARYLLAGGLGAVLASNDPLAASPMLAVVDLDLAPGGGDARIRLAAPLDEDDLPGRTEEVDVVAWDSRAADVRARRERRFGALTLASSPLAAPARDALATALAEGVRDQGLGLLRWPASLVRWRQRVAFLRAELGEPWNAT
ncbi:MAG: ATP-dependent helicase HrpB, partial [Acidimicrobiia bacterium]|nr:ATP-dependent helicase HrpB [Acidimicrobiia bacterium]